MPLFAQPSEQRHFEAVREAARELDGAQLAAAAGALTVLSANGHRLWRLGALATLAAERVQQGRQVTQGHLRDLVNGGVLAAIAGQQDDPFDDLLTEELAFHGGSYLVASGLAQDAVYVLRLLMRALLLTEALPGALRSELTRVCMAGLQLSDHALRAAGLERHLSPSRPPGAGLEVPGQSRLRRLMEGLTFTDDQLAAALGGTDPTVLDPLVLPAGERRFDDAEVAEGLADRWPLVRFTGRTVLARPFDLGLAVRHHLLRRAVDEVGSERAAAAFAAAVQVDVFDSLRRMGISAMVVDGRTEQQPWVELQAELDAGLRLVCIVAPDPLDGLSEDPYGMYSTRAALDAIHARFEQRAGEFDGQMIGLLIAQPAGRSAFFGIQEPEHPNLTLKHLSAADLEALAFLEPDDALALWKFARAHDALRQDAQLRTFSTLDSYAVYLDRERSMAPMRDATLVLIPPGSGGDLRRRAKAARDRHGARHVDGSVREVERERDEGFGEQLYFLSEVREPRLVRHIAAAPLDLWVAGPEGGDVVQLCWDLVETVAYWLAELVEPLHDRLAAMAPRLPCLQLEVDVADRGFWFGAAAEPAEDPDDRFEVDAPVIRLVLGAGLRERGAGPDNAGERELVALMLEALDALAADLGLDAMTAQRRAATVEQVAPPGLKKHLIILPAAFNPLMVEADGRARTVQEADLSAVRYELGAHLMQRFGLGAGPVPDELRGRVVREAVEFLLAQVQALLDATRPEALLEALLVANERIIADSEQLRSILPARAATYPSAVDHPRLRDQLAGSAQAGVCCRFLAEYVAARPPAGAERWSLRRYDRALALVALMLDWAYLDDALHEGMSDVGVLLNSDGQLRLQRLDRYERGRSAYFDRHVADQRRHAERIFSRRFDTSRTADPSEVRARVDPLMANEAGASLTELGELLHTAADLARTAGSDVLVLSREQALDAFAGELGWEREKVDRAVSYLSMGTRDSFLAPPGGSWRDVVPSRFSRRFSLNRRPLLARGDELLWGQRQPLIALQVLLGQIFSGRFQALAETPELESELGRLAFEAGKSFEREVATIFGASPRFEVRQGLTAMGGKAIERDNGDTLGDIDVLAADTVTQVLYGVECKDLAGALTPTEVAGELSEHFGSASGTSTSKHAERIAWLDAHRAEALSELGLDGPSERWRVRGLFVTGHPVMALYIKDLHYEIVPVDDLPSWIGALARPRLKRDKKRKARRS